MPMHVASRLLTVEEAARQLGVHPGTVHRWVADGALPAVQPGGPAHTLRIDSRDLLRSERRVEEAAR